MERSGGSNFCKKFLCEVSKVDMLLFGKKVEIYEGRNYEIFKALKKLLKKNGISYGTGWVQTEVACGCGAKINMRQVINPNYSPYVWSVYVRPENEEKARRIAEDLKTKSTGS